MSKVYTDISRKFRDLIGGENIIVENNSAGNVINFDPQMEMYLSYRGNFHAFELADNSVTVRDTSFCDPGDEELPVNGGTVKLRWQKIVKNEENEKYYSLPCSMLTAVPALTEKSVNSSAWLLLQLKRTASNADITINDDHLGEINCKFSYMIKTDIPLDTDSACYAVLAALIIDENDGDLEIIQQQTGIPEMWIPLEISDSGDSSSSSSSSSSHYEPPEDSSSSFSSSSSSSSSSIQEEFIVALSCEETSKEYASADEVYTSRTSYQVAGRTALLSYYPAGGYRLTLTGTKTVVHSDGTSEVTDITGTINLFHNTESGYWDYTFTYDNNWNKYFDYYDLENDIMYTTPQYIQYSYASAPHNPLGMMMVDRKIVYGYSQAVPTQEFSSSFMLHVYI